MTVATQSHSRGSGYLERPAPSSLADVIETILDKGLVIDAYVRVSLVGIELLTIDARIVIASVDTYLRFAEAANRLDLNETGNSQGLPELLEGMTESGAKGKTGGAIEGAKDKFEQMFGSDDSDDDKSDDDENSGDDGKARQRPRRRKRPQPAR
jgi:gas vesicle structural protein